MTAAPARQPYQTHPSALEEMAAIEARCLRLLIPPPALSIGEWASANRTLPQVSGRPGPWVTDPIQVEIQDACCDPEVSEVVFMKATRLGWSEICNNALGWGIDVHAMAMLMLQPTRDTAEAYAKERLDDMIESTPALREKVLQSTSKKAGSTTRFKQFSNGGNLFVASAGNPRELRSRRARFGIEDEADGYENDVEGEGDPDAIVRRRGDEYWDFRLLIGSTPALPSGISRIERAYNRSSMGIYKVPCPHCNALEPFLWRHPQQKHVHLLTWEKDSLNQVIPESVAWTCIRCGAKVEERWKVAMMREGAWHHRRPELLKVRGFWANGLYVMTPDHWLKLAQEWVNAQGNPIELKAFINLNLAETYEEPGESVEKDALRAAADAEVRPRGIVPRGVAVLVVTVDVQTAGHGRLEAQVVGWTPDEKGYLIDFQRFDGDPLQAEVWADLDDWLLAGWQHEGGAQMQAHLVLIDSSDGNTNDSVYGFCQARALRWVFPLKGHDHISSKGFADEGTTRKSTVRLFNVATDLVKRNLFGCLALMPSAPKSIHLADWVTDEYVAQVSAEKRVQLVNPRTRHTTYRWVKTRDRNEALDLWVYAKAGFWILTKILAPHLGGPDGAAQLQALAEAATEIRGEVSHPQTVGRRIRSRGVLT